MQRPKGLDEVLDEILNALSDETRRAIVRLFDGKKELGVTEIVKNFNLSRPNISHHLGILKRSKILTTRKVGTEVFYTVDNKYFLGVLKQYIAFQEKCCGKK